MSEDSVRPKIQVLTKHCQEAQGSMRDSCDLRRRALRDVNVSSRRDCLQHKMIKKKGKAEKRKHHILANKCIVVV